MHTILAILYAYMFAMCKYTALPKFVYTSMQPKAMQLMHRTLHVFILAISY